MPTSNELRLFLSSTFIDFQAERDFLTKKVFPGLRSLCRDRGVEFTEIDLRWGLTQEDAEQGRIIGTCLQEIDNCRPFFIGLLGERYGWVPATEEFGKDPELRKDHPWLEASFEAGQSVTEMEFRHGFLNHESWHARPLVYFRSLSAGPIEEPPVTRLKNEVTQRLGPIPVFSTPAELASQIEKDLIELIETNWPAAEKHSWIDEERAGHAAFAHSRRKGYVANPSVIDALNAQLEQPDPIMVVTGESGSGKSSLLSYWVESLRTQDPNLFIVEHYIGVTAASTDPDTLMRRIVEEIKERIHSDDPVPQSAMELEQSFPSWLGRMTGERLLIVIDAINQLNPNDRSSHEGRFLAWLPDYLQSNIRWVISSTQSEALDRLRDRSRITGVPLPEIAVTPITVPERRRVLQTFLASYQKKLSRAQEEQIVNDEKSSSPLFLRTLLEELRVQGKHFELDHYIAHYLESFDIPDLFSRILERLEFDYGTEEIQTLLTRIWAAPQGLSESEIIESSNLDRATLSLLLHAFDFHLIRVKGRLSFFHDYLRTAVEGRYLDQSLKKQEAWKELALYFQDTEASSIKALSLPWLLSKAEQWHLLMDALLDLNLIPFMTEGSRSYDLLSYWNALEKREESVAASRSNKDTSTSPQAHWHIDVVGKYESALTKHPEMLDASKECPLRYALALFFRNAGWYEGAVTNAAKALELSERTFNTKGDPFSEESSVLSFKIDICLELGKAYLDRGDLKHASETLEKAMRLLDPDWTPEHAQRAISTVGQASYPAGFELRRINVRNEYARLLRDQGKYADAESVSQITLNAAQERFGTAHSTTQNEMRLLADIMTLKGKFAEAESLHRAVVQSVEVSLGPDSLDLAYYLNQFADFIKLRSASSPATHNGGTQSAEYYEEAQQLLERAVAIIENRLGDKHPDLGALLNNFASLHSQNGNWEKAEPLFLKSLAIVEVVHGPEHLSTGNSLMNYAAFLYIQGKYDEAELPVRRALAIRRKALGENHPHTAQSYNNLANLLRRLNRFDEAEESYAQALKIRLATIGPTHIETARTYEGYGGLMRIIGKHDIAEDFLSRCYETRKQSIGPANHDTIFVALTLAEVLLEETKPDDARDIIDEVLRSAGSEDAIPDALKEKFENVMKQLQITTEAAIQ
jgi:tetratricopeptide (TPR) repeat protein